MELLEEENTGEEENEDKKGNISLEGMNNKAYMNLDEILVF